MNTTQEIKDAIKAFNELDFKIVNSSYFCPSCKRAARVIRIEDYKFQACEECYSVLEIV